MTSGERVRDAFPGCYLGPEKHRGEWVIWSRPGDGATVLGSAPTKFRAWAEAEKRIEPREARDFADKSELGS